MDSTRDLAYKDYQSGMKYKDIADKHGVSLSAVKSWASRDWKKVADKKLQPSKNKKVATKEKKSQPKPKAKQAAKEVDKIIHEAVEENEELTEKQKLFCVYFVKNLNATQAYLRAYGGSYNVAQIEGYRNLTKPKIKEEIKRLKKIKNAVLGNFSGDDVVELHMRIAFADIEYLLQELRSYGNVQRQLREATTIREASDVILISFLKPANQGESAQLRRAGYSQAQFDRFAGQEAQGGESLISVNFNVRVTGTPLNVRVGPGTNYKEAMLITQNIIVTVIAEANGEGGDGVWYMIVAGDNGALSGWISRKHTEEI